MRREPAVDRPLQPRHVEQHVDRDHDDQDQREEEEDHRERRALRERRARPARSRRSRRPTSDVDPVVDLLLDLDVLEPVVVEPGLQPVDVLLRPGHAGASVLLGDVRVDAVGRRVRVWSTTTVPSAISTTRRLRRRAGRRPRRESPRGRRSRCRSRTSGLSVNAITEAVRNRKSTCPSVRASMKARNSEHRQPDELDPARDPDRRRPRARVMGRIRSLGEIVSPRSTRLRQLATERLRVVERARHSATVQSMATPRSRQAARLRARRRRAQQRARRLAVLSVVGVLGLVTLAADRVRLGHARRATRPLRRRPLPTRSTGTPEPLVARNRRATCSIQLPVAAECRDRLGFHGSRNGALELQPARPPGERGPAARLWHRIAGTRTKRPGLVPARRLGPGHPGAQRRRRARHRRVRAGRRDGRGDHATSSSTVARRRARSTSGRPPRRR